MSKYSIVGVFLALAACSSTYVPASTSLSSGWQVGSPARADVRWTPNPDRGSASSTLSGGRRGASASACAPNSQLSDPAVTLLVPEGATGLTTEAQPTLSWYLESETAADMEFVLSHPEQATPVYTQRLRSAQGLVEVALPAAAALDVGTRYRWTVFVACDGTAKEIHARSFVERIADSDLETSVPTMTTSSERASAYAAKGVWFDALNALMSAYRTEPRPDTLSDLQALLEQAQADVPIESLLATAL
ncbi:MAG: DUF928 domain-containing protein [Phormidesmis sp.]